MLGRKAKQSTTKWSKTKLNLIRQTVKISILSSENVSKYEFLTGKDVLPEKELLEKAAAIKRFEYSPLCRAFVNRLFLRNRLELLEKNKNKIKIIEKIIIKTITENDENKCENVKMVLLSLPKKEVEGYVKIDKKNEAWKFNKRKI